LGDAKTFVNEAIHPEHPRLHSFKFPVLDLMMWISLPISVANHAYRIAVGKVTE